MARGGKFSGQFVDEIVKPSGGDLYLSVRKENTVTCQFYARNGMKIEGIVAWKNRTIPGLVYRLNSWRPSPSHKERRHTP
jgi:hypothetical protein